MYRQMYNWVMKVMNRTIQYFCLKLVKSFGGESANHVRRTSEWQKLMVCSFKNVLHNAIFLPVPQYLLLYHEQDHRNHWMYNRHLWVTKSWCHLCTVGICWWAGKENYTQRTKIFNKVLDQSTFVCYNFLRMLTLDVMHSYNMYKSMHLSVCPKTSL